jgi:ribonuclease PH
MRTDNRRPDQMRPVRITTNYLVTAEGSALIEVGHTRVLCAASVEESVPQFLRGSGRGWVTAEYSMLPRATATRTPREVAKGRQSGRTLEIQRLIGRSLRTVVDTAPHGDCGLRRAPS